MKGTDKGLPLCKCRGSYVVKYCSSCKRKGMWAFLKVDGLCSSMSFCWLANQDSELLRSSRRVHMYQKSGGNCRGGLCSWYRGYWLSRAQVTVLMGLNGKRQLSGSPLNTPAIVICLNKYSLAQRKAVTSKYQRRLEATSHWLNVFLKNYRKKLSRLEPFTLSFQFCKWQIY